MLLFVDLEHARRQRCCMSGRRRQGGVCCSVVDAVTAAVDLVVDGAAAVDIVAAAMAADSVFHRVRMPRNVLGGGILRDRVEKVVCFSTRPRTVAISIDLILKAGYNYCLATARRR